jgi:hypothetical protein
MHKNNQNAYLENLFYKRDYYIDRCDLWGFTCEINSGLSHVRYQFFPAGTTFTKLYVWWLRPLLCYGEYTHDCKLKQKLISRMLETGIYFIR